MLWDPLFATMIGLAQYRPRSKQTDRKHSGAIVNTADRLSPFPSAVINLIEKHCLRLVDKIVRRLAEDGEPVLINEPAPERH